MLPGLERCAQPCSLTSRDVFARAGAVCTALQFDFLEAKYCQGWSGVHSPAETSWVLIRLQMDFVGFCISSWSVGCSNFFSRNLFGLSVMGLGRRSSGVRLGLCMFYPNVVSRSIDCLSSYLDFNAQTWQRAHMWVHCQSC